MEIDRKVIKKQKRSTDGSLFISASPQRPFGQQVTRGNGKIRGTTTSIKVRLVCQLPLDISTIKSRGGLRLRAKIQQPETRGKAAR